MKIAIIKLSALGDIIHTSIVLQFIKKNVKNAHISWIVDEKFADILYLHEDIDELIALPLKDKKYKESLKILKKRANFDVAIDFQGLLKSAIVGKILCKNLIGFDKNSIREKVASLFYKKSFAIDYGENIILRNLKLASLALNFSFTLEEILQKKPCFLNLKNPTPNNNPKKILISIGSSWQSKIYPKELYVKLIKLLLKYDIYLSFGNDEEKKQVDFIASNSKAKILPPMSLKDLVKKMNEFDLIIGSDSGVTHLAFAQNLPSITLFGNTPYKRNAFLTNINKTLHVKEIDPLKLDKSDDCIKHIKPEDIANLAKEML